MRRDQLVSQSVGIDRETGGVTYEGVQRPTCLGERAELVDGEVVCDEDEDVVGQVEQAHG